MHKVAIGFYAGLGDLISAMPALAKTSTDAEIYVFVKNPLLTTGCMFQKIGFGIK